MYAYFPSLLYIFSLCFPGIQGVDKDHIYQGHVASHRGDFRRTPSNEGDFRTFLYELVCLSLNQPVSHSVQGPNFFRVKQLRTEGILGAKLLYALVCHSFSQPVTHSLRHGCNHQFYLGLKLSNNVYKNSVLIFSYSFTKTMFTLLKLLLLVFLC